MTTYTEYLTKVQEDVLSQIKEAQDASLKGFVSLREIAGSYPATFPTLPKFEGYPTPTEIIEQSFDFAEKLIELRKDYTLKVAEMIENAQKQTAEATARAKKHNN